MPTRALLALLLVTACQSPAGTTGVGSTPGITSAAEDSAAGASTTSASTTSASTTSASTASSGSEDSADTTGAALPDLGPISDLGSGADGCKGKVDLLFVLSRQVNMPVRQQQLIAAMPQFLADLEAAIPDLDHHTMVITGDDGWGNAACNDLCAIPGCKVGDPCCTWYIPEEEGTPCCRAPDYPCQDLDIVTPCDRTWGAGELFPAGISGEPNKPCPIDDGRRYLVTGQSDLQDTFACVANAGNSGGNALGQALAASMGSKINGPGGCNDGFLRKDALLMVVFLATTPDVTSSAGTPNKWAQAVIDAKHGDDKAVVMVSIFWNDDQWNPDDRIGTMLTLFPYRAREFGGAADYGPIFANAAGLLKTACTNFMPPK